MTGKKKLIAKLQSVLAKSAADQTEIVFIGSEAGLTRYANSYIHQNVYENNSTVLFRTIVGKRVGVAVTNSVVASDLKKALDNSIEIAKQQPEHKNLPGLPGPAKYRELDTFDEKTARFTPAARARAVKKIIGVAERKKFTVAGSLATSQGEIAIVNSLGVEAYQPLSSAAVNIIAMSDTSSGYASGMTRRVDELDVASLAKIAVGKCDQSQNPVSIEPGDYEVILEPAAVSEILEWLNYTGFGSKAFEQKTSFLAGKTGKKVTSELISIYDNGLDDSAIALPFDFEGVPKRRVPFIQKGIAKGVVYDTAAAHRAKVRSTGHAVTADQRGEGAYGFNIFMSPGKTKRSAMISRVKRGLLVTRFHYINGLIDTRNSVLTGMTRDGTLYIENGEVKYGIKNLRFTDSIMRAFGTAIAVSKETERKESWWRDVGCMTVPTLHLKSFRFTGKTDF